MWYNRVPYLVLDHLGSPGEDFLVVLVDGVVEVVADCVKRLLGLLEVVHGLGLLFLEESKLLLDCVAEHVELLLLVAVLLGVGVEGLDAELKLDVRASDRSVNLLQTLLLLVDKRPQREVQHPEVLKVLLVDADAEFGELLVGFVEAGFDRTAALSDQLLD